MKIVVFGTGKAYRENKDRLDSADEIIAFLDNDPEKQGTLLDDIEVYPPGKIETLDYEKIVIMSDFAVEMQEQLLMLGCSEDSLIHYREYFSEKSQAVIKLSFDRKESEKSCLIITSKLGYHGGAMVAVYAARELMRRGYRVVIAAPDGNDAFIEEFQKTGIEFIVNQDIPYLKWNKLEWVRNFQKIIVNTYPMVLCALEISRHRAVSLWLHESNNIYPTMRYWKDIIKEGVFEQNLRIYAVSDNAKQNFINNVTACDIGILPYGIPDIGGVGDTESELLRFAVIGSIHPIKQQLFFLKTVKEMSKTKSIQAEFVIIGRAEDREYAETVCKMAETMEHVRIIDELQRKEMDEMYQCIDVVVVPSIYDSLPIVATEAMMNGKVCIVSDSAGTAQYITPGENGFVFSNNNGDELREKLEWCIENKNKLKEIGERARKIFEENFTLEALGDRLVELP